MVLIKRGFTLFEVLIVIGIVGVLASIVILAINPKEHFKKADKNKKEADMRAIKTALDFYIIENGKAPIVLDDQIRMIGTATSSGCAINCSINGVDVLLPNQCVDLSSYLTNFLAKIPVNGVFADDRRTQYAVRLSAANRVEVFDCASNEAMTCLYRCDGKVCGDDGCGGQCGVCGGVEKYCSYDKSACLSYNDCPSTRGVDYAGVFYPAVWVDINKDGLEQSGECWLGKNLNVGIRTSSCSGGDCSGANCSQSCASRAQGATNYLSDPPFDGLSTNTIQKYCYNDSESYCDLYGGLYSWNELMGLNGVCRTSSTAVGCQANASASGYLIGVGISAKRRGICPPGWHIPSDYEWTMLENALDLGVVAAANPGLCVATANSFYADNTCSNTAMGYNGRGTNNVVSGIAKQLTTGTSTINLLYGGYNLPNYLNITSRAYYWTATQRDSSNAWRRYLSSTANYSYRGYNSKGTGISSVRCVKD